MLAVLPDATAPDAVKVNGPETVCPAEGDVNDAVGKAIETVTDLETTSLCFPVESIILNVKV